MVRDCLKELKAVVMTKDILNSTKIGIIVNKVKRDCKLGETQQLAKALLADWRAQVGLQGMFNSFNWTETLQASLIVCRVLIVLPCCSCPCFF